MTLRKRGGASISVLVRAAAFAALLGGTSVSTPDTARAVTADASSPAFRALRVTQQTGRRTVIGVTSREHPDSQRFWHALLSLNSIRELSGSVAFVEVEMESEPEMVQLLKVHTAPTVLVYGSDEGKVRLLGFRQGERDPHEILAWLRGLGLPMTSEARLDPAIGRAGFPTDPRPTPQQPSAFAPPPNAPSLAPTQGMRMPEMAPPGPASVPAQAPVVVAPSSVPIVVQPAAPTVLIGPTPPPNVYYATGAPLVAQPGVVAAPQLPQQVSLQAPPTASPTLRMPELAPAQPIPAPGLVPATIQPATIAMQPVAPVTPLVGLVVEKPGPFKRMLGSLGRYLSQYDQPRLSTTALPQAIIPPATAPVMLVPAMPELAPGTPTTAPAALVPESTPSPQPTPQQAQPTRKHGWFR